MPSGCAIFHSHQQGSRRTPSFPLLCFPCSAACAAVRAGVRTSHWFWFAFPLWGMILSFVAVCYPPWRNAARLSPSVESGCWEFAVVTGALRVLWASRLLTPSSLCPQLFGCLPPTLTRTQVSLVSIALLGCICFLRNPTLPGQLGALLPPSCRRALPFCICLSANFRNNSSSPGTTRL